MTDDRSAFTEARDAGLRQRHEQRLAPIKAEALREAATAWLGIEDDPSDPVYRFLMERADHLCPVRPS